MEQLQVIERKEVLHRDFKVYGTKEDPLFLAKDVANWIEHSKVNIMLNSIDENEKLMETILTSGQRRNMWFITEDGLYELLMQSRKPVAKQFKKEVKKILKELRVTGSYEVTKDPLEIMKLSMQAIEQTNKDVSTLKNDVTYLKDEVKLDAGEYNYISKHVKRTVMEVIESFAFADSKEVKGELFKDINSGLNEVCGIKTRTQLRQKHFDRAMQYINAWVPSTATRMKVQQLTLAFAEAQEEEPTNYEDGIR